MRKGGGHYSGLPGSLWVVGEDRLGVRRVLCDIYRGLSSDELWGSILELRDVATLHVAKLGMSQCTYMILALRQ